MSQAEINDFIQNMDHSVQIDNDNNKKLHERSESELTREAYVTGSGRPPGCGETTEEDKLEVQLIRDFCKVSILRQPQR